MIESKHGGGPREVLERLRQRLEADDKQAFADLLAADGVVEWPFTPPGVPERVVGRDAMRSFLARAGAANRLRYEQVDFDVHDTQDPEVIVAEMRVRGTNVETGSPFRLRAIAVMRARDGEIVSYRDYIDPLALARVTGQERH